MESASRQSASVRRKRPFWWRAIGLRRREHGRVLRVGFTAWGWFLVSFVAILAGMFGFAEYSMQPQFCNSCHIMQPYYTAWHESTHGQIPCGDCHFEPGWRNTLKGKWQASSQAVKYLTRTYGSKPHAEIRDASCLREGCHDRRLLEGLVEWEVPTQRGDAITIHFDHRPHLGELRRGKQLRCVSCHSQIVQGQHIVVTLDTCFTCHMKGMKHGRDEEVLGGCGSCHGAPKAEIRLDTGVFQHAEYLERGVTCENCHAESIKGDGEVPRQLCWTCHNKPAQLRRYSESRFIHQEHVTDHKIECSSCHIQIEHHLSANLPRGATVLSAVNHPIGTAGTCGQCHEASHAGPAELYRGVGGRGVPEMPSPMYTAQVDCIACHKAREYAGDVASVVGQTYLAAQAACDYCHGNRYEGLLDVWKRSMNDLLVRAESARDRAVSAAASAATDDPAERLRIERLLADVEHNVRFVRLGHGVHNVPYSTGLLNHAIETSRDICTTLGVDFLADPGTGTARAEDREVDVVTKEQGL